MKDEMRGKAAMILRALSETARTASDRLLRDPSLTEESLGQDLAAMEAQLRRARSAMSGQVNGRE